MRIHHMHMHMHTKIHKYVYAHTYQKTWSKKHEVNILLGGVNAEISKGVVGKDTLDWKHEIIEKTFMFSFA